LIESVRMSRFSVDWSRPAGGNYYEVAVTRQPCTIAIVALLICAAAAFADGKRDALRAAVRSGVVKAGPSFELLAVNEVGDNCLATPAISNGALFIRTQHYVWSVGAK
jgi:hypothetical protein